jgi:hypothetical protein
MLKSTLTAALALLLIGCEPAEAPAAEAPSAEPAPEGTMPASETLAVPDSIPAFLRGQAGEGEGTWRAAAVDLDGDGADEVVAYLMGAMWCGSGGCNALVLAPEGDGWRVVTETSVTQTPIRVLETSTNGWRDLSVGVGGGGRESGQVRLTFDGSAYPTNPTVDGLEQVDPSAGEELIPEGPGEPLP